MKDFDFATKKLMTPGPVPLPEMVKKVFSDYECHHRSKEFGEILLRVFSNLKTIFQTQQHCYLLAATGTGALEAGFLQCVSAEDKVLTINAGKFGERWGKIAKAYGISYEEISVEWGRSVDLNLVREKLKKENFKALAFQACETSTGSLLPVKELCEICQETQALSLVDGITALGAVELPMDQWNMDVVVGGSQKAFMLPTGLSFVSLSQKAEQISSDIPSYYFNLKEEKKANLDGKTRYSSLTQFVLALDVVLDEIINKVGFENHLKSIREKADFFRSEVNLELFPDVPSPSLSCLKMPALKGAK
ncbi:MAG: aminotransferase class V-fold PLP-dependent enzyme, partial [Pseudomonadota bacterium]